MAALWYAVGVMNANAVKKLEFAFHGDSMNVLGAFIDGNKVKAKHPIPLRDEAENLLANLHDGGVEIDFVKEYDTEVKKVLGH
jgi:hypothetical protein